MRFVNSAGIQAVGVNSKKYANNHTGPIVSNVNCVDVNITNVGKIQFEDTYTHVQYDKQHNPLIT